MPSWQGEYSGTPSQSGTPSDHQGTHLLSGISPCVQHIFMQKIRYFLAPSKVLLPSTHWSIFRGMGTPLLKVLCGLFCGIDIETGRIDNLCVCAAGGAGRTGGAAIFSLVASSWPNHHASLRMIMQYILSAHRQVAQTQDRSEQKRACGTHRRVGNVINIMCSFDHDDSGFPCSEYGIHVSTTLDWYPA